MCGSREPRFERIRAALAELPAWTAQQRDPATLGAPLIAMGELIDRLEAARAELLRRFEKSAAWKADGALSVVAWLRWKCKLSGGGPPSGWGSRASWRNGRGPRQPSPVGRSWR